MAKKKVVKESVASIPAVEKILAGIHSLQVPKPLEKQMLHAESTVVKLAEAIIRYNTRQVKLAENEAKKVARVAAKKQRGEAKAAKIKAQIAKLQEQLKQTS